MAITYDQGEYIRKQYLLFLKSKITVDQVNSRLQKYFNTEKDFRETLNYCKEYNKGYSLITWEV